MPGIPAAYSFTVGPDGITASTYRLPGPENLGVRTVAIPVPSDVRSPPYYTIVGYVPPSGSAMFGGRVVVFTTAVAIPTHLVGSRPHSRITLEMFRDANK